MIDRDGGTAALAAVRALRAAGLEPWVSRGDGYAARSRATEGVGDPADAVATIEAGPPLGTDVASAPELYVQGLARNGEIVCACHQRVLRTWYGSPSFSETIEPTVKVDVPLGYSGPFGVRLPEGRFEPWMSGQVALSFAAGQNVPALWVQGATDAPDARVGIRLRVEEDDYRAIFRNREWSGLLARRHTAHAVLARSDPRPALVTLRKLVVNPRVGLRQSL
ncbi:MAG: hypothetical protein ACJ77M_10845 [Thermoleophilaceae bacterium]